MGRRRRWELWRPRNGSNGIYEGRAPAKGWRSKGGRGKAPSLLENGTTRETARSREQLRRRSPCADAKIGDAMRFNAAGYEDVAAGHRPAVRGKYMRNTCGGVARSGTEQRLGFNDLGRDFKIKRGLREPDWAAGKAASPAHPRSGLQGTSQRRQAPNPAPPSGLQRKSPAGGVAPPSQSPLAMLRRRALPSGLFLSNRPIFILKSRRITKTNQRINI